MQEARQIATIDQPLHGARQPALVSGVDDTVTRVIMPVLREVGDGWESGELGVLHEHFVSSSFRGVLGELRMPVQAELARTVILACPPRELHDLPLELFGAMLHARGWRVVSLGANTPMTAGGEFTQPQKRGCPLPKGYGSMVSSNARRMSGGGTGATGAGVARNCRASSGGTG